jgi:hypothetical protein
MSTNLQELHSQKNIMKKVLLALVAILIMGATSCKKEAGAQPEANNAVKVLDKKDTTQWD